jgi:predicted Zn-ribbon and HTH transcriptional regulator
MNELFNFFIAGIALIMIITFFVMASQLSKILKTLQVLLKLEIAKPENTIAVKCEKCGIEFKASILKTGELVSCPSCKTLKHLDTLFTNLNINQL